MPLLRRACPDSNGHELFLSWHFFASPQGHLAVRGCSIWLPGSWHPRIKAASFDSPICCVGWLAPTRLMVARHPICSAALSLRHEMDYHVCVCLCQHVWNNFLTNKGKPQCQANNRRKKTASVGGLLVGVYSGVSEPECYGIHVSQTNNPNVLTVRNTFVIIGRWTT